MTSTRHDTALKYLSGFESLSAESFASVFTPTFVHTFAPASISPPPPLSKDEFTAHISHLRDVLRAFPVTAKDVIEDERSNRVVIWATSEAHFHDHVKDNGIPAEEWAYKGEYIFVLALDSSGAKVDKVLEFVDSKGTERLRALMQRARGNI